MIDKNDRVSQQRSSSCGLSKICSPTLIIFVSCKLWTYVGIRFLYPLSQFLGDDWHLSSQEMSIVLAAGEFVPAGFFSSAGDVIGPNKLVIISFGSVVISSSLMLLPPNLISLVLIRFLYGFSMFLFMIAAQTAATSSVEDSQKDCITGLLELPFSFSALTLLPLLSLAYEDLGWRAPFAIMAIACVIHYPLLIWVICRQKPNGSQIRNTSEETELVRMDVVDQAQEQHPPKDDMEQDGHNGTEIPPRDVSHQRNNTTAGKRKGFCAGLVWGTGALAYNLSGMFLTTAVNLITTEFGFLLHSFYKLDESDAGTAALVMGFAEFCGVLLATRNFGPDTKAIEIFSGLFLLCVIIFTVVGSLGLVIALLSLFPLFLLGELGTVQRLSRADTFANAVDATAMLGSQVQFQVIGRTIGALVAAPLFFQDEKDLARGHFLSCSVALGAAIATCVFARIAAVIQRQYLESEKQPIETFE